FFENAEIQHGQATTPIRIGVQTTIDRANRVGCANGDASGANPSDCAVCDREVAQAISRTEVGASTFRTKASTGGGKQEAESQDRRPRHAERTPKKTSGLRTAAEKRRYVRDHRKEFGSVSKGLQVTGLASSTYYYPATIARSSRKQRDARLRDQIEAIQAE